MERMYKCILASLCKTLAELAYITEQLSVGECIEAERITFLNDNLIKQKHCFLDIKEELHIAGSISFSEDNAFDGFEIKNGLFSGDHDKALRLVQKWFHGLDISDEKSCYRFEVANYIIALVFWGNEFSEAEMADFAGL